MRFWIRLFIACLLPAWCQGCGRLGAWVCNRCWQHVQFAEGQSGWRPTNSFPSLKRIWSLTQYDPHIGKLLQAYKYQGVRVLGAPLGEALARQFMSQLRAWHVEAIVPVPLHPKRYLRRGYNQAGILAQVIGEKTNIPVDWLALQRVAWSATQAKQDRAGRLQLQTAFRGTKRLQYTCICLVDDVATTGSTLSACARALNQAGVKTVVALTVARA